MSNVPVFTPTYEEFRNFSAYISKIESLDAHKIGLAKIIPPKEWLARRQGYKQKEIDETLVENPIKQEVHGKDGFYSVYNIPQKSIKLNYFEKLCQTSRYATPTHLARDYEKLEKKYWQNLTSISPIYGADVSGSFYDKSQRIWNITNLGTILDDLETEYGTKIEGVNTSYLYFGMWKATFAWHTEDMDLYSINYLHFGAPKQWYVIPPSYGKHFENFAASRFPSLARRCPAFLRHKMTLIPPSILTKQSIPYSKMTQHENEFIITFPYAYHAGFNYGFNCAESTNFALERWIEYGKHSIQCACRHDMVKIGMDRFVLKYQPDLYGDWCRGVNRTVHPEANPATNGTIVRSSPTKRRILTNQTSVKNLSTNKSVQLIHQEQISEERYRNIYRNLSKFDQSNQLSTFQYSQPLVRAALSRVLLESNNNPPEKPSQKLLNLTAEIAFNFPSIPNLILFHGLKQSNEYHENLLDGLWSFQKSSPFIEQHFNQWLTNRIISCAICYLFHNSMSKSNLCSFSLRQVLNFEQWKQGSHELIQCHDCRVSVHRDCYENVSLALNVHITENEQNWICQRCDLKRQVMQTSSIEAFDDRCSACLFRGGLLLQPTSSASFTHAICSIYRSYKSKTTKNSSCHYCWSFCPLNYRQISTHVYASCDFPHCSHRFHLTCGLIHGCTFDINSSDYSTINAHCHLHPKQSHQSSLTPSNQLSTIDNLDYETIDCLDHFIDEQQQQYDNEEDEDIVEETKRVPIGTRVRLNDRKEEKIGRVIGNEISFHYVVDFGDGCYSHDMLAEDILDFDPSIEPFTLTKDANIRVKWTDGMIYSCKYVGRKRVLLYRIQFDNETRQIRREEFVYDIEPPSPPLTPCQSEREHNYSRRQSLATRTKRKKQQQTKRKRKRVVSSSSEEAAAAM